MMLYIFMTDQHPEGVLLTLSYFLRLCCILWFLHLVDGYRQEYNFISYIRFTALKFCLIPLSFVCV